MVKKQLGNTAHFSQLVNDLENQGLTYQDMMQKYSLTRWGARKLGNHEAVTHEESGNHEKIFYLKEKGSRSDLESFELPFQDSSQDGDDVEVNYEEVRRNTRGTKQQITNKAGKYLTKLEKEVKNTEIENRERGSYREHPDLGRGSTVIIHETDAHFSAYVKNREGSVVYDTETAAEATRQAFTWYIEKTLEKTGGGKDLDEVILLFGGDLLEGEGIYETQPHKISDTLEDQITAARKTYFKQIQHIHQALTGEGGIPLKIVCVSGNHGDLKIPGSSTGANADDIIYSMLEDMIELAGLDNVKFVKSDRSDYTTFTYRGGKWKGYLTHGENRLEHVGTSSPQSDWLAIKDAVGFDAAWRGHYHNQKVEEVNGAPIVMTNSRKPADDYTDKIAAFGKTGNALYFATDEEPLSEVITRTDVLENL